MAYEIPVLNLSFKAGEDLSGAQYRAVKLQEGKVFLATVDDTPIGILQDKPKIGQGCAVMVYGVSKAIYGAQITAGQKLTSGQGGAVVPASSGDSVIGIALEDGGQGEIHSILLIHS